ncbi:hypothetical protein AC578_7074 [Pseudocercospora eumusae]|uniref:HRDC domain-containing protein n=1 Tax=Pseudocercospora eumusae TaxID=321146 RepID=A0A139GUW5_9PEZI|nr:hypothetical protein AC578_7074 [Pseudocercospora eumusae]
MEDFSSLESNIKSALVSTVRSANSLANEDLPFHRSLHSKVGPALDQQNARLLSLAERLVGAATSNTEIVRPPRLRDLDSVEGNWRAVVDVVDSLLERADTALDEFTGAVKRLSPGVEQANATNPPRATRANKALRDQQIEKPQLLFDNVPKNDETGPFKPLLSSKPHAAVPLETEPIASDGGSQASYPHPYQLEIEQYRYPSSIYTRSEPIMYHPFESTTATLVDSEVALEDMLKELKQAKEIAIDLEHHDMRTYIGIVSLMQISTRDKDWIVDTLKPWRRKLQCLNEVFADPNILKVLHGAHMDIIWLQRDLGLYIVGLFDTHHASRALGYTSGSLAYLLKRFADVDAQKKYQTADWRVRPLPQELFDYARSDTHYLLYIFDNMRNELIQRSDFSLPDHEGDKLWDVLTKSSETALQRYEHPIYDTENGQGPFGWYKLLAKASVNLTKEQFSVFRAVHQWRDEVAREQDDSTNYVLQNWLLFNIAKSMPTTRQDLFSLGTISQTVRLRANELVALVAKAKKEGINGPELAEVLTKYEQFPPRKSASQAAASKPTPAPVAEASAPTSTTAAIDLSLRSSESSFWGPAFESSVWKEQSNATGVKSAVSLSVPLPPLTAEIFADPAHFTPAKVERHHTSEPTTTKQESAAEDDVFVLKDLSKKRKRGTDQIDGMAANTDEVTLVDADDAAQYAREKANRKAAKRAARKAAKAAAAAGQGAEGVAKEEIKEDEEEPFDYENAASILNPPKEKLSAKELKKRQKQINPYAKALDTAKGLPRTQKEKAGRSMTFKS